MIWIRLGNCSTRQIGELLRDRQDHVQAFCLAITDTQLRDGFALSRLAEAGKLSFVQQTINAPGQIFNKMSPSGASTEHRFEGKVDTRG